jgi:hypothetical protein
LAIETAHEAILGLSLRTAWKEGKVRSMAAELISAKITPQALKAARLIAAASEEHLYEAMERVLVAEAVRLGILRPKGK